MTNKDRLQVLLNGGIPDRVPHFELDFYMENELFGLDMNKVLNKSYPSLAKRNDAILKSHIEIMHRLVDELGYASVYFNWNLPVELGITEVKKALGDKALIRTYEWHGVYWMPSGEDLLPFISMMYERPDELHANASIKCDVAKEKLKRYADAGTDFFLLGYDFGFNKDPFIGPDEFTEFVTPYLAELVQYIHDLGLKAILHSDGDINLLLDEIYSTGVDGLQSVDPTGKHGY